MRPMMAGSGFTETAFISDPQRGHTSGSTSNTRLSGRAQEARDALAPADTSVGSGGFARVFGAVSPVSGPGCGSSISRNSGPGAGSGPGPGS